ncbi:phenylacetate--CoA ligase family protein [Alteromonas ponticola]|uniref:Phenylacetate--CoA ligase family protein n=1 Tax=Alteromonas ponticola TaxID=2720613 RepID=A0ABX1QXU2_9ALTE|nr:phenylacetate--CoA ligase family protein [Alteromonas ponticola]NMH59054.1 phenylacetate--CoA ligase family protein [Alteromonas ponticola]
MALLSKFIYLFGAKLRNPSLMGIYSALKKTEFANYDELEKIQLDKLKTLLKSAYQYSPFYRDLFDAHNFDPEIETLSDIKALPTITKRDLIEQNAQIHSQQQFKKTLLAETSGTSGEALAFYRNEEWDSTNRASVMRCYDWYNVKPWDKNGYFWGYNIEQGEAKKVKLLDWLQNRIRIFRYDDESITAFAKDLNSAKFLSGYSSMIYQIAKKVNALNLKVSGIKMVKGTSEMILDAYQPEVKKAFGCKMISEYGAAESGLIAFECPEGSMHINMENVYVEIDDNKEIIVTNLASHSFPIIRYRLGDYISLGEAKCACGRAHKVIKEIYGRKGSSILGTQKEYPALTFYYVFKNIALKDEILINYKAEQFECGTVILKIEGQPTPLWEQLINREMNKYFGDDLRFSVEYIDKFETQTKKQQYFESFIK